MRKLPMISAALFVTGAICVSNPTLAQLDNQDIGAEQVKLEKDVSAFVKVTGVITDVKEDKDTLSIVVEDEERESMTIFPIGDEVKIFTNVGDALDKQQFKEGMKIEAYYDKSMPILMIYPATIPPELIIVQDENELGQVKVAKFDEQLLSLDNELKLILSEETILQNEEGEDISEQQLTNKELVVFYTISTKSIPAQTTPHKIVALDEKSDSFVEDNEQADATNVEKVALRQIAESFGYEVIWQAETLRVILKNQNESFQLVIGDSSYVINNAIKTLDVAPKIIDGKTYVPTSFIQQLRK